MPPFQLVFWQDRPPFPSRFSGSSVYAAPGQKVPCAQGQEGSTSPFFLLFRGRHQVPLVAIPPKGFLQVPTPFLFFSDLSFDIDTHFVDNG